MLDAEAFCDELHHRGFTLASGVPCSHFRGPIELLSRTPGRYVPAADEGGALAVAAGAALGGQRAYVMLQNSGLGNLISPLTSLTTTYRIPVLTFVSLRGWPDPADDEPQHSLMGPTTHALLDTLGIAHRTLRRGDDLDRFREILDFADTALDAGGAPFVLVEKGSVGKMAPHPDAATAIGLDSAEVVRLVAEAAAGQPVVATTGYTSRELFGHADAPTHFYMQGSMGHAPAVALGLALARPDRTVHVLDGDGAALMHMGGMSVIGHIAPANLVHIILDNGVHDSTGGQRTTSTTTSFRDIGRATGYRTATDCATLEDVQRTLLTAQDSPGPHLLVVPTAPRTGSLPARATSAMSTEAFHHRFRTALTETATA